MYTIFHKLRDKFNALTTEYIVDQVIDDEDLKFIEELNREQLEKSTNVDGESLGVYHATTENKYNQYRSTKVSAGDDIKMYDTGRLYDSIKAEFTKDKIEITSDYNDAILGYLESVYGDLIGLSKENREYVMDRIKPKVVNKFREKVLSKL